jgi:hypothetical protein
LKKPIASNVADKVATPMKTKAVLSNVTVPNESENAASIPAAKLANAM